MTPDQLFNLFRVVCVTAAVTLGSLGIAIILIQLRED